MNEINKNLSTWLTWSIIFTLFLPCGVPMIELGAVYKQWVILAFGIVFVVLGFYGMPLLWTGYGNRKSYKRIVFAVVKENILSINQIATHLNVKPNIVLDKIDTCIRNGYIVGYIREGDTLTPNVKFNSKLLTFKCTACGANFDVPSTSLPRCPYCGTIAK